MKKKKLLQNNCDSSVISLNHIINDALVNLKNIVDVNTVIGEEIITKDGTTIIPVSKIIVGYVAGGGEMNNFEKVRSSCYPFAGGSGAGFTVVPIGFLSGKNGNLKFICTEDKTAYNDLLDLSKKALKLAMDNIKG